MMYKIMIALMAISTAFSFIGAIVTEDTEYIVMFLGCGGLVTMAAIADEAMDRYERINNKAGLIDAEELIKRLQEKVDKQQDIAINAGSEETRKDNIRISVGIMKAMHTVRKMEDEG